MFVWVRIAYSPILCLQQQVLVRSDVSPLHLCSSDRDCEMPARSFGKKICEEETFVPKPLTNTGKGSPMTGMGGKNTGKRQLY